MNESRNGGASAIRMESLAADLQAALARTERLTQALRFTQIVSRQEAVVPPDVAARVGGADRVLDGVEMLYDRLMVDPELGPYFQSMTPEEMSYLIQQQAKMLLALFGAGDFVGRRLWDAHQHHHITRAHFERLLTHLAAVLSRLDLTPDEVDAFITRLRGFESDVVNETPAQETA